MPVEVYVCYATTGKLIGKFKPSLFTLGIDTYESCLFENIVKPLLEMIISKLKHTNTSFHILEMVLCDFNFKIYVLVC